ncbi:hypothetical protein [Herbiconiux liukaitaii]|uniref:hypothetical protein n=1 Tax=Herbiconiux liukaitaii TaxID=3342799 RepID=UPI0035BA4207
MRTTKRTFLIGAVLAVTGLGLSGCAGGAANAGEGEAGAEFYAPSLAHKEALADGHVDRAEYERGFAAFEACMSTSGYTVEVLESTGSILDYRYLAEATDDGTDARCYQTEFEGIDGSWQTAHQEERTDGALLDACLTDNGLAIPTTRQEKVDALVLAGVDLGSCLGDG